MTPAMLLDAWLAGNPPEQTKSGVIAGGSGWLLTALTRCADPVVGPMDWSAVGRQIGRGPLFVNESQRSQAMTEADRACHGWNPGAWTRAIAGRVRILLALPEASAPDRIEALASSSTVDELVALHVALPLLPGPQRFVNRAAQGVRSNLLPVFQAIALDNPFPCQFFDDGAWSQLVLKAFFTNSDVDRIHGLSGRVPALLGKMLADYARERGAAGRPVDPRLFRYAIAENSP